MMTINDQWFPGVRSGGKMHNQGTEDFQAVKTLSMIV